MTDLISLDAVASRMGISPRSLRAMVVRGDFGPAVYRLGHRTRRVREKELTQWISAGMPSRDEWRRKGGTV